MTQVPSIPTKDRRTLRVTETTTLAWTHEGEVYWRRVPEGFEYVPGVSSAVMLLLSVSGHPYALQSASCLHDYLYAERESRPEDAVPRTVADAAIWSDDGDPRWLQAVAWGAVRAFGWIVW